MSTKGRKFLTRKAKLLQGLITKELLNRLYYEENKSQRDIARILNISIHFVEKFLSEFNIKIKSRDKKILTICASCFKEIRVGYARFKKYREFFCSQECRSNLHGIKVSGKNSPVYKEITEKPCASCGKTLFLKPFRLHNSINHFCDAKCQGAWHSDNLCGPNHWRFGAGIGIKSYGSSWYVAKRRVRKRDKCCKMCGKHKNKENETDFQTHHYVPFRLFGKENHLKANHTSNLGLLCSKCHLIMEKNARLFWDKEFIDKTHIIDTFPVLKHGNANNDDFHYYSVYR